MRSHKVEVFRTNVGGMPEAQKLLALLLRHFPDTKINFDLEDCDRILRVEGKDFAPEKVMRLLQEHGFSCSVLP
ncbi:hypothetical protein [Compostibacter hankyongensis]